MQTHSNECLPKLTISRRPDVLSRFGIGNTCLHSRIKEGLIPPSISLGGRSVGWLDHELDQVMAAMVAGKSKDQIKMLVDQLVDQRKLVA
ncbi:MAG: AlpA family transcriptional regulator [Cellvibrionaceae bacterium]